MLSTTHIIARSANAESSTVWNHACCSLKMRPLILALVVLAVGAAAMHTKDAIKELGLPAKFNQKDLKAAYRKKSLTCHPDKGGSTEAFLRVAEAYETLSGGSSRPSSFSGRPSSSRSSGSGVGIDPEDLQEAMRKAEEMFDKVFEDFFEKGFESTDALVDNMFGDAKGPAKWLLKKVVKKIANAVGPALVSAFESEGTTINFNGMKMSGEEFKEWRKGRRVGGASQRERLGRTAGSRRNLDGDEL